MPTDVKDELRRVAARMRKRYQRVKEELRSRARAEGLLSTPDP